MTGLNIPEGDRTPGVPPWQAGTRLRAAPVWTWRPNGDTGTFHLFHNGEWAGELALRAGLVKARLDLLETIINHLNKETP